MFFVLITGFIFSIMAWWEERAKKEETTVKDTSPTVEHGMEDMHDIMPQGGTESESKVFRKLFAGKTRYRGWRGD